MTDHQWPYRAFAPLPIEPDCFTIWIAGVERNRLSACSWETQKTSSSLVIDAPKPLITGRTGSKQWRAYLAAIVGAVERLPPNSHATICSLNQTILDLIDNIDAYQDNSWRKKDGKMLADIDILVRIIAARTGERKATRNIALFTKPAETDDDLLIINALREEARCALDRQIRGNPPAHVGS